MEAIEAMLDEARLLWHAMVRAGERLHGKEPVTLGMRAVLEFLALHGPSTVPRVARSRHVTRQHIQALVNSLLALGLASLDTNPEHRRSALVRLTPEGEKTIERMRRRERRFFDRIDLAGNAHEMRRAAETLRSVRTALEGRP
jgi:DNA-binding MarR family transcriptional regulator